MQDMNRDAMGDSLVLKAHAMADADRETYGDPSTLISKKRIITDAILRIAGCDKGAPVTPQVIAALDAGAAIVGMLNAPLPGDAVARLISTGINAAPIAAMVDLAIQTAMARRPAAEQAPQPPAEPKTAEAGQDEEAA